MGRESKSVQLKRQSMLALKMSEGEDYTQCLSWYVSIFFKSEGMFQKDRTAIYKRWKTELAQDDSNHLVELIKNIDADRQLARDLGNAGAAIQADKLKAQILGILNKQGEVNIENATIQNNTLNIDWSGKTLEELKQLLNK